MYKITSYDTEKHMLKASLLNSAKEIEILEFLAGVLPEYTGVLNKRLETFLSKKFAEKYGTYEYKWNNEPDTPNYGKPSEYDKTINNVSVYLSSEQYTIRKYYKLTISYKGTDWGDTWDDNNEKVTQFIPRSQTLQLYSWETLDELAKQVQGKIEYTNKEIVKIKQNIKHLDSYARSYNKLVEAIELHNDKISYVIADNFKIRSR